MKFAIVRRWIASTQILGPHMGKKSTTRRQEGQFLLKDQVRQPSSAFFSEILHARSALPNVPTNDIAEQIPTFPGCATTGQSKAPIAARRRLRSMRRTGSRCRSSQALVRIDAKEQDAQNRCAGLGIPAQRTPRLRNRLQDSQRSTTRSRSAPAQNSRGRGMHRRSPGREKRSRFRGNPFRQSMAFGKLRRQHTTCIEQT